MNGRLKAHHPAAFLASLLNAGPMGFYHPATLVKDARHHGTDVLPIDVTRSGRLCRVERLCGPWPKHLTRPFPAVVTAHFGVRLGLRYERGLSRRTALWQAAAVAREMRPPCDSLEDDVASPLPAMSRFEETISDQQTTELTAGPHLIAHFRPRLRREGVLSAAELTKTPDGAMGKAADVLVVRQRPGMAKGFVFPSLEDETGMCQAIFRPDLFRENRPFVVGSPALVVERRLQKKDGTLSVRAERFGRTGLDEPIPELRKPVSPPYPRHCPPAQPSHDFR